MTEAGFTKSLPGLHLFRNSDSQVRHRHLSVCLQNFPGDSNVQRTTGLNDSEIRINVNHTGKVLIQFSHQQKKNSKISKYQNMRLSLNSNNKQQQQQQNKNISETYEKKEGRRILCESFLCPPSAGKQQLLEAYTVLTKLDAEYTKKHEVRHQFPILQMRKLSLRDVKELPLCKAKKQRAEIELDPRSVSKCKAFSLLHIFWNISLHWLT